MKILVTGAAGFIGSHTSERLKKLGHEVVGLDNFNDYYSVDLKRLNEKNLKDQGIDILELDLTKNNLPDVVKDAEVVYHFAAKPGIEVGAPLEPYISNNINAVERLYQSLKDSNKLKLFIYISTSSVYGAHATDTEETAPKPNSYYGVTKLAGEQLLFSYNRNNGFPVCSTRLFSIYGPRERPEKLYTRLIDSIFNETEFPLYESAKSHVRSYTYVSDVVDGFISILENYEKCVGEIFNLGIDSTITTGEGIEIVEELIGKKAKFKIISDRPGEQLETKASIKKARDILGYNPSTPPTDGLKKQVEWYKENIWKKIKLYQ